MAIISDFLWIRKLFTIFLFWAVVSPAHASLVDDTVFLTFDSCTLCMKTVGPGEEFGFGEFFFGIQDLGAFVDVDSSSFEVRLFATPSPLFQFNPGNDPTAVLKLESLDWHTTKIGKIIGVTLTQEAPISTGVSG